jgi:hypothetical protein
MIIILTLGHKHDSPVEGIWSVCDRRGRCMGVDQPSPSLKITKIVLYKVTMELTTEYMSPRHNAANRGCIKGTLSQNSFYSVV